VVFRKGDWLDNYQLLRDILERVSGKVEGYFNFINKYAVKALSVWSRSCQM
jgi:hypothetical protein